MLVIDLPTLDGVAFIDPRSSQVDIVQAVGRAIRKSPEKKVGTVVLPVFIEEDENAETALDRSIFKPVWNVLKALRAHDAVLAETLDNLRRQLGRYGSKGLFLPKNLFIDLPVTVGKSFAESFKLRLVEKSTASWEFWFGLLQNYVETNGDVLVPSNHSTETGCRLGAWVVAQRQMYVQGKLSLRQQQVLERLPGWVWNTVEANWREFFHHLCKYVKRYGDALVPQGYKTDDGVCLGAWVTNQRLKYRNGQLDQEKQEKLGRLSGWTWDPYSDQWQEGYKHLNIYVKREGNALVPAKYKNKEGFTLGRWVRRRRWDYSQGKLSAEKRSALEQLPGWTWDVLDDMWQEGFDHLREYAHHKGSALVPRKYVANDGYNLGNWVVKQRSDRRKGKLSLEQQNKLEELRDWAWDKKEVLWMECLAALREYAKREGNTFVPRTYFTKYGYNLGTWVTSRRRDFKLGKLSFEKQKLLEQIHGWVWDTVEDAWQEGLRHLQEYIKQEGTTVLPAKYITEDGYKLESWVVRQRAEYRRGKLPPERKKAFDQVPGWTWDTNESIWQKGFAHLRDYIKAKGDALVPATYKTENGFRLGQWVRVNRKAIQERRLCKERRKALEQLVEWTWGHHEAKWQEGFRYLRAYVEREGHAGLSRTYITKDGYKLGQWVGTQRAAYQRGKLSSER